MNHYYLIELLVEYQKKHGVEIDILEYNDRELIERLLSGNCQAAFLYEADVDPNFLSCSVNCSDELVALVPKESLLRRKARFEDIPFELYLPKENSDICAVIERLCRHSDSESLKNAVRNAHHSNSVTEAIKHGYGYTLLPRKYVEFQGKPQFNIAEGEYSIVDLEPMICVNLNCVFASRFTENPIGREFFDKFIR